MANEEACLKTKRIRIFHVQILNGAHKIMYQGAENQLLLFPVNPSLAFEFLERKAQLHFISSFPLFQGQREAASVSSFLFC